MLTKPGSKAIYSRLCSAPAEFLRSAKGKELIAKCAETIKTQDGEAEAQTFLNLMAAAECIS